MIRKSFEFVTCSPLDKMRGHESETQTNHNPYLLASKEKAIVGLNKKKQDTLAEHF